MDKRDTIEHIVKMARANCSHGESAMRALVDAMIKAGVTEAAFGALDNENVKLATAMLESKEMREEVCYRINWGDAYYKREILGESACEGK